MHLCEVVSACTAHVKNSDLNLPSPKIFVHKIAFSAAFFFIGVVTILASDYYRYTVENFKRLVLSVLNL